LRVIKKNVIFAHMKFVPNRFYIIVLLLLASFHITYGQVYRALSGKEGLSDMVVNSICKSAEGYIWMGTSSSVERFDGAHFRHFPIPVKDEKKGEVNVVGTSLDNIVYAGTNSGIYKIENDQITKVYTKDIKSKVFAFDENTKGVYVGTDVGLYLIRGEKVTHILVSPNTLSASNSVFAITHDQGGTLWLATGNGIYYLPVNHTRLAKAPAADNTVYRCMFYHQGKLLLGASNKIRVYDTRLHTLKDFASCANPTAISMGRDQLYVATNGNGIYVLSQTDGQLIKRILHDPSQTSGLRSNSLYSFLIDREGIMWSGLFQIGVDYTVYQRNEFTSYQLPDLDMDRFAIRTIEVNGGCKLIGSRDGLFFINEKKHIYRKYFTPELRSQLILCSCYYQGLYYIGTFGGGLYVLDPQTGNLHDFNKQMVQPFMEGQVFAIEKDRHQQLWIGTSSGMYCYNGKQITKHYDHTNSHLGTGAVYHIFFDSQDRGWICMDGGIYLLSPYPERIVSDEFPEGFPHNRLIRYILEDSRHQLFFLPDKGNMYISNLQLDNWREVDNASLQHLQFAIEDSQHWLWVGTNDGLYRFDKKSLVIPYTFADGLPTSIFLNCSPKIDEKGNIWFGSAEGLFYTNVSRIKPAKNFTYPLRVTEIDVDDYSPVTPQPTGNNQYKARVKCIDEGVNIAFSDFSYTDPDYMTFEYKMDGEDDDWVMLQGKSDVYYRSLSFGTHHFHLRRPGVAASEITVSIFVMPSVMAMTSSAIGLIILIFAVCYAFYRRDDIKKFLVRRSKTIIKNVEVTMDDIEKYKSSNISEEECMQIAAQLKQLMEHDKVYLDSTIKIASLADMLKLPTYKLSYLFNQYLKVGFYDYINEYRVEEFVALIQRGEQEKYTLNAMMGKCGFTSRSSFFRYFKKKYDMSPNEYISKVTNR
jgi:ligand-binding sensor domain-containing protein/AraC-like DNA-binding protein